MNLMAYQQGISGKENKVLTKLFPGWKENGELVSFMYPITVGRHVLEPAGLSSSIAHLPLGCSP